MITYLDIAHFKSIEKLHIKLDSVTVLVGDNGSGKSNFVDAIQFIKDAVTDGLAGAVSARHGIDSIRQWSSRGPYDITLEIGVKSKYSRYHRGYGHYLFTLRSKDGQYQVREEKGEWTTEERIKATPIKHDEEIEEYEKASLVAEEHAPYALRKITSTFERQPNGNVAITQKLKTSKGEEAIDYKLKLKYPDTLFLSRDIVPRLLRSKVLSNPPANDAPVGDFNLTDVFWLDELRSAVSGIETYAISPNTLRQPQPPMSGQILNSSGSNIASILKALDQSRAGREEKTEIVESLQVMMPGLTDISIHNIAGLLIPIFKMTEADGTKHDYNVSQISSTTMRMFGVLTALHQLNPPAVTILEEPEQSLGSLPLSLLGDSVKNIGERRQIIVTTYTPGFVDEFKIDQIRAVEKENKMTTVSPIARSQKQAVEERLFTLGELLGIEGIRGSAK